MVILMNRFRKFDKSYRVGPIQKKTQYNTLYAHTTQQINS